MKYAALVAALALVPGLAAQDWASVTTSGPAPRQLSRIAHDVARNRVVLFGGYQRGIGATNDTWLHDGVAWTKASPLTVPPARDTHALCYDGARNVVLMFGGVDSANFPSSLNGETWEWTGQDWQQRQPQNSPTPRFGAAMAYDSRRQKVVLFGGADASSYWNDTWEWDGNNWSHVTIRVPPPGRSNHGLAYDVARQRIVLFGGTASGTKLGDTWEYDGSNWTQIATSSSPEARTGATLAYDLVRGATVLHGGLSSGNQLLGDTWEYDGEHWLQYRNVLPIGNRTNAASTFWLQRRSVIVFGGAGSSGELGDTWEFGGLRPSFAIYGRGCTGAAGPLTLDVTSLPALGGQLGLITGPTPQNAPVVWILGLAGTGTLPFGSCELLRPPFLTAPVLASGSTATQQLGIPANNAFAGLVLPWQAAALDASVSAGFVLSNLGRAIVN